MKVRLTPEEQAMLRGERGEAKRVALEKIVELAEILGAEELVPVTKAHLCCGSTASPADFPDGVLEAIGLDKDSVCTYCWNGKE